MFDTVKFLLASLCCAWFGRTSKILHLADDWRFPWRNLKVDEFVETSWEGSISDDFEGNIFLLLTLLTTLAWLRDGSTAGSWLVLAGGGARLLGLAFAHWLWLAGAGGLRLAGAYGLWLADAGWLRLADARWLRLALQWLDHRALHWLRLLAHHRLGQLACHWRERLRQHHLHFDRVIFGSRRRNRNVDRLCLDNRR